MSNKKIIELILNISGFTLEKYEIIRDGTFMVGYEFEAHKDNKFEFSVASDSFEDALAQTLEYIYNTANVTFTGHRDDKLNLNK